MRWTSRRAILGASALLFTTQVVAQTAIVVVESINRSNTGVSSTNTTITVPIDTTYTGDPALQSVSNLYITGSTVVALNSISCTPVVSLNASGRDLSFNSSAAIRLSPDAPVQVNSITCRSVNLDNRQETSVIATTITSTIQPNTTEPLTLTVTSTSTSTSTTSSSIETTTSTTSTTTSSTTSTTTTSTTSSSTSSSSSVVISSSSPLVTRVSTAVVTQTASSPPRSTVTQVVVVGPPESSTTGTPSATRTPGLSGVSAAPIIVPSELVYHALAVVGLGIAFVL